jgi:hypothetical protein
VVHRPHQREDVYCWLLQPKLGDGDQDSGRPLEEYTRIHHQTYSNFDFQPKVLELITGIDSGYFQSFWEGGAREVGANDTDNDDDDDGDDDENGTTARPTSSETSVRAARAAHNQRKKEVGFEDVWREALGHPPIFKPKLGIRLHDFSLNHVPNTPVALNLFRFVGFCCWLIGPLSAVYVLWLWSDVLAARCLHWSAKSAAARAAVSTDLDPEHPCYVAAYGQGREFDCIWSRLNMPALTNGTLLSAAYVLLRVWTHLEAGFLVYMQVAMYYYGRPTKKRGPPVYLSRKRRESTFEKFVATELADKTRGRKWIASFFLKAKYRDLRRENLRLFWAMRLFESDSVAPEALTPDHLRDIERYVDTTIACLGEEGPGRPGMNKDLVMFNTRFDAFQASHHPLVFYFITEFVIEMCMSWLVLWWLGFQRHTIRGIKYWHRPAPPTEGDGSTGASGDALLPLLMFPGVGVGFLPYKPFFKRLSSEREMFLVELPYISLRICGGFDVFSADQIRSFVHAVCAKHGIGARGLDLVGHSFGTSCVANCMKGETSRAFVNHVTMIDPVSFAMQSGDLVRDFLYDPYEDGRIYLVNREPHLAHVMMRGLEWYDCILWPEDIAKWPQPPLIVLSGNDNIVPSTKIKEMLMRGANEKRGEEASITGAQKEWGGYIVMWLSDTDHGGFLFEDKVLEEVVETINRPPQLARGKRFCYKLVYPGVPCL